MSHPELAKDLLFPTDGVLEILRKLRMTTFRNLVDSEEEKLSRSQLNLMPWGASPARRTKTPAPSLQPPAPSLQPPASSPQCVMNPELIIIEGQVYDGPFTVKSTFTAIVDRLLQELPEEDE